MDEDPGMKALSNQTLKAPNKKNPNNKNNKNKK
jgi:hypothetical protein